MRMRAYKVIKSELLLVTGVLLMLWPQNSEGKAGGAAEVMSQSGGPCSAAWGSSSHQGRRNFILLIFR